MAAHPAKACYIATKHRLADILAAHGGSMELNGLLAETNIASADHLFRILRCCESQGIFSVKQDGDSFVVHNTPDSCTLIRDSPGSLAPMVLHCCYESALALNHLDDVITSKDKSKDTAWDFFSPNKEFWAWLDQKEQREARLNFNTLMVNITMKELPHICNGFDWKAFLRRIGDGGATCSVVDIGGGKGHLLRAMLDVASFRPVVFDTPHMIEDAREFWKDSGADIEFVTGDFFKSSTIPAGNVYVLKHILHDWSDAKSIEILKAIREQAIKVKNSRVILIELVLDESKPLGMFRIASEHRDVPTLSLALSLSRSLALSLSRSLSHACTHLRSTDPFESWVDIQMLNVVGGKERSRRQWENDVLSKAGFKLENVHVTGGTEALVECSVAT